MDRLDLPDPRMMDVAVPANRRIGFACEDPSIQDRSLDVDAVARMQSRPDVVMVDLRETEERQREGVIPGSVHVPYPRLDQFTGPGGLLAALAREKRLVLYCAYGERSALALGALDEAGLADACHLAGGIDAWRSRGRPLDGVDG